MAKCLISIGSNLGDRSLAIDTALAELKKNPAITTLRVSSRHTTPAIGGPTGQDAFINAAALLETSLPPLELFSVLQNLESSAGRTRVIRWGARSLDLDLLLYDDLVMNDEQLVLPHPRMAFRRFVLAPASEIAPGMLHPILGRSISQLLEHLEQAPNYVAITGVQGVGKTKLAKSVAARIGARDIIPERSEHSAGRSLNAELELLKERCDLLRGVVLAGNEPYVISDFWLGQSIAYVQERMPSDGEQISSAWSTCCQQIASPKLIVFLVGNVSELLHDQRGKQFVTIQRNLRQHLLEPGQPPMLELSAANPSWNEEEVAAAILAM